MNIKYFYQILREYARSESDIPLCPDEAVNIIIYLQQGEKYRHMWEELEKQVYKDHSSDCGVYLSETVFNITPADMKFIEQKYFPKEAKQDYPEGEE